MLIAWDNRDFANSLKDRTSMRMNRGGGKKSLEKSFAKTLADKISTPWGKLWVQSPIFFWRRLKYAELIFGKLEILMLVLVRYRPCPISEEKVSTMFKQPVLGGWTIIGSKFADFGVSGWERWRLLYDERDITDDLLFGFSMCPVEDDDLTWPWWRWWYGWRGVFKLLWPKLKGKLLLLLDDDDDSFSVIWANRELNLLVANKYAGNFPVVYTLGFWLFFAEGVKLV